MNTVNKSTGYSPFQLPSRFGRSPRVIPPLTSSSDTSPTEEINARKIIEVLNTNTADAKDNLMLSKFTQAYHANNFRSKDTTYNIGDKVLLSTLNRRRDYKTSGERRVAKFMPRYDGPYPVVASFPEASTVTLDLPNAPKLFPTFHTSHVKLFKPNDDIKYPSRTLERPGPIQIDGSQEYYLVDKILDHKKIGQDNFKYLVRWLGCD